MKLVYRAVTRNGKTVRGVIEGKEVKDAVDFLRSRELLPIQVAPQKQNDLSKYLPFINAFSSTDLVFFTRQLASMLSSGLTLMQALRILKEQVQKDSVLTVIQGIVTDVEDGKPLSQALTKYPKVFSPIYISLITSAEVSGLLDKVLLRLADNLEKQEQLKSTIKSALMYPMIVIIGMIVVVVIMMIFVIPQLSTMYEGIGIPLPLPTLIIIGLSNFVIYFWPLIILGAFFSVIVFKKWRSNPSGRLITDDLILKVPIFGKLIKESILTEFSRTFGILIGSGTLVVDSLKQSADVAGNVIYKNAINETAKRVEKGLSIGDALAYYPLFPPILVQTVKIGEQTGKVDESLLKVSEYFEREVEQTIKTLTTALEPIIMVVLGVGVAFLIISVITPIYSLTNAIQ